MTQVTDVGKLCFKKLVIFLMKDIIQRTRLCWFYMILKEIHENNIVDNLRGLDSTLMARKRTQKEKIKSALFVIFPLPFLKYGRNWSFGVEAWAVSLLLWRLWHQPPRPNQFGSQSRVSQSPALTYLFVWFHTDLAFIWAQHISNLNLLLLCQTIFLKLCVLVVASCVQAATTLKTRKL